MAVVTYLTLTDDSGVTLEVEVDDAGATLDAEGAIVEATLVAIILTVTRGAPVVVRIHRSNPGRTRFVDQEFATGVHTFSAGGPVRRLSDLSSFGLRLL